MEYMHGIMDSHVNYHIPTMENGKTTQILSILLWDFHKTMLCVFVPEYRKLISLPP